MQSFKKMRKKPEVLNYSLQQTKIQLITEQDFQH